MFNIGPLELVVLAFVGLVVLGPDRLPGLARDAARMIRTLRELATGARTQLREELGPEFADLDLRSLNPRTAITQALLGDEIDPNALKARNLARRAFLGNDIDPADLNPKTAIERALSDDPASSGAGANGTSPNGAAPDVKPVSRPAEPPRAAGEAAPFDSDAT